MKEFKKQVIQGIKTFLGDTYAEAKLERLVTIPTKPGMGDFTFPCFGLAKEWSFNNPMDLAQTINENVEWPSTLITEVKGGYLNFHIKQEDLVNNVLKNVLEKKEDYGRINIGNGKMIVVDYSAPNIGKPLHVGHIRSTILGDSIIKMLKFAGYKTHGINYLGDVGLHIGKTITAYNEWGDKEKLEQNPEKEILNLYIEFCKKEPENPLYVKKAKEVVDKIEKGDPESIKTLDFLRDMSMTAFNRVYELLDVDFDEITGQSKFSDLGKEVVKETLEKKVSCKDKDGAIIASLKQDNLPDKVILRSDGTAIYSTQDLGAAKYRKETFDFDKLLYVVASEQELYFRQVFKIIERTGYNWAEDCIHINFGMINLEEGKMSTREGKLVYLEEVLNKAIDKATQVLKEKSPGTTKDPKVSKMLGVGAIKYMVLGVDYGKDIEFSWDRALDFTGNSATYIQYTNARAESILRKTDKKPGKFNSKDLTSDYEMNLIKKIGEFPLMLEAASRLYKPHIIANYSNEVSTLFNQFYNKKKVIKNKEKVESRLSLVKAYTTTVKNSMNLLGIKLPNRM